MTADAGWVDVHHHGYHPTLVTAMRRRGVTQMAPGVPVPAWRPAESLRMMEENALAAAVLSVLLPDAVSAAPPGEAADLARLANESTADLVRDRPDRFGSFASLPMPHVDRVLAEITYAFDELAADGVVLSASQPDGRYLGDPAFGPVFDELNRRKAVVFIHPNPSAGNGCGPVLAATVPPPLVEFVLDTTRAVALLLFGGTLQRCPDIRFVLAHAGGTIPFLAWRLALAHTWVLSGHGTGQEEVATQLRRLYYETAQSASTGALGCLRAVTDDQHLLFGTDFPFMTGEVVAATRHGIVEAPGLDPVAVGRGNALAILPRLAASLGQRLASS